MSRNRVGTATQSGALSAAVVAMVLIVTLVAGCSRPASAPVADGGGGAVNAERTVSPGAVSPGTAAPAPISAQPELASDPVRIVVDLVDDEQTLRRPDASESEVLAAAGRQQKAYRVLARHPEWDVATRPRVPDALLDVYDRNIDARRQLGAMGRGKPTLPAWRVHAPRPAPELLRFYREAEAATGVGWNYLAAINFVETAFGRISGVSTAGAQGPMQFLPSTFAIYGKGTDIWSPRDAIMAAGRFLAAQGFARDRDHAIFRYNNSRRYVRAINQYAALMAAHRSAFASFHRWDVYYNSVAGDVLLPEGYESAVPVPVEDYLRHHPQ